MGKEYLMRITNMVELLDFIKRDFIIWQWDPIDGEKVLKFHRWSDQNVIVRDIMSRYNAYKQKYENSQTCILSIDSDKIKTDPSRSAFIFSQLFFYYKVSVPEPLLTSDLVECADKDAEEEKSCDSSPILYYFIGRSGSGKNYISRKISDIVKSTGKGDMYIPLVPITTRPKRENEVEGVDYIFLTDSEFDAYDLVEKRAFTVANGEVWKYGTSFKDIERGKGVYCSIGTIESAVKIMQYIGETHYDIIIKFVDIMIEDTDAILNLIERGTESTNEIYRRYVDDELQLKTNQPKFNRLVSNKKFFVYSIDNSIASRKSESTENQIYDIACNIIRDMYPNKKISE